MSHQDHHFPPLPPQGWPPLPYHPFPNHHHNSQTSTSSSPADNPSSPSNRLAGLAGSLDPSTGIFYRTPEHPRLRTAQACEKCRTRKAKCSGEHPSCKRCINRGLLCEYAKEGRVRGPNKPKSKPNASSLANPSLPSSSSSVAAPSPNTITSSTSNPASSSSARPPSSSHQKHASPSNASGRIKQSSLPANSSAAAALSSVAVGPTNVKGARVNLPESMRPLSHAHSFSYPPPHLRLNGSHIPSISGLHSAGFEPYPNPASNRMTLPSASLPHNFTRDPSSPITPTSASSTSTSASNELSYPPLRHLGPYTHHSSLSDSVTISGPSSLASLFCAGARMGDNTAGLSPIALPSPSAGSSMPEYGHYSASGINAFHHHQHPLHPPFHQHSIQVHGHRRSKPRPPDLDLDSNSNIYRLETVAYQSTIDSLGAMGMSVEYAQAQQQQQQQQHEQHQQQFQYPTPGVSAGMGMDGMHQMSDNFSGVSAMPNYTAGVGMDLGMNFGAATPADYHTFANDNADSENDTTRSHSQQRT